MFNVIGTRLDDIVLSEIGVGIWNLQQFEEISFTPDYADMPQLQNMMTTSLESQSLTAINLVLTNDADIRLLELYERFERKSVTIQWHTDTGSAGYEETILRHIRRVMKLECLSRFSLRIPVNLTQSIYEMIIELIFPQHGRRLELGFCNPKLRRADGDNLFTFFDISENLRPISWENFEGKTIMSIPLPLVILDCFIDLIREYELVELTIDLREIEHDDQLYRITKSEFLDIVRCCCHSE
ncbi:hypothetical protein HK098_006165 [Nowakowskiella sp. JEL0407]|nr:hypothetical protein HK098_006165 [Nowakowskiella sp. JEL0407]